MSLVSRTFVTAALVAASLPTRAHACSGPCTSPELWGLVPLADAALVVTNFGLLSPQSDGWQLTCEEVIGGILLAVKSNAAQAVVSTDVGLFVAAEDACGFTPGPTSGRSSWFLDFALAADSSAREPHLLALVSDPKASVVNVELAQGNTFEILHVLGSETAYRHIEASRDLSAIVAAGYASQPRRWQLAWSVDAGDSWQEFTPDVASSASAALLGLDPNDNDRAFFQLQATDETAAELWSVERTTATATRLFVLDAGQAITGLAFVGNDVWLSSKGASAGGLYRSTLQDAAAFTPVLEDVPPIACLGVVQGAPYVCVDDYTADSPFLLAKVNIEGNAFEAVMTVSDLGQLRECDAACDRTRAWLDSAFGNGTDTGGDTDTGDGATDNTTDEPAAPEPAQKADGGCAVGPSASEVARPASAVALVFALIGLVARVRRRSVIT